MSQAKAKVKTVPAPNGGLNARDGLANMAETDAVQLTNWIPDSGGVRCRKGYSEWAINFPESVISSIVPYFAQASAFPGGTFLTAPTTMPGKLFAASDVAIYEITNSTNAPAVSRVLSGGTYAGWLSSTMMVNSAGTTYALVCSEADGYFTYDGAAWVKVTLGGGATQVSVGDPTTFVHVSMWKRRAFFVQKNTSVVWYLAVDSPYGVAAKIDFGPMFKHGGHLAYTCNWTIDAGEGIDDLFVAVSSNGDVVVYKGTDPSSGSTFALVGTWFVGQIPLGRRGYVQYGGDIVLLSADGIYPISYVTRGGSELLVAGNGEYSSLIRPLLGADIRASFTQRGWQLLIHPSERLMISSVPDYGSRVSKQYAMSTSLNKWCQLSGVPIYCMGSIAGYTFAGTVDGRVLLLFNGFYDDVAYGSATGNLISGSVTPAFNYFGVPSLQKQFLMVRPVFVSQQEPQVQCDISVDFKVITPSGTTSASVTDGGVWGTGLWGTALWGGGVNTYADWYSVGDTGFCGAATVKTESAGDTILSAIDYSMQLGRLL